MTGTNEPMRTVGAETSAKAYGASGLRRSRSLVGISVLLLFALFLVSAKPSLAAESPKLLRTFGPDGTAQTAFAKAGGVAVDQQSGDVYVADTAAGVVYKFDQFGNPVSFSGSAAYLSGNALTGLDESTALAIDQATHVLYVVTRTTASLTGAQLLAFQENGEPAPFSAGPDAGTNEISGFVEAAGVATDSEGNIYVSDRPAGAVHVYGRNGEVLSDFASIQPNAIAVGPSGTVYVAETPELGRRALVAFMPDPLPVTSATSFSPDPEPFQTTNVEALAADPTTGNVFAIDSDRNFLEPMRVSEYDTAGNLVTRFAGPGDEGELEASRGVAVNGSTGAVYASEFGEFGSHVGIFAPRVVVVGPPAVTSESVTDVSADAATIHASIEPNSAPTTYRVEYGTADCALLGVVCQKAAASSAIPPGARPVNVAIHIAGLESGTTYHYRVVAESSLGPAAGGGKMFHTEAGAAGLLADGRQWELTSPASQPGGGFIVRGRYLGVDPAAEDGSAVSYTAAAPLQDHPVGNRAPDFNQYLSVRSTHGWVTTEVSAPHAFATPLLAETEIQQFNSDLSQDILQPAGIEALSDEASELTPYLEEPLIQPIRWRPLVTGKEPFANVPPGTVFGGTQTHPFTRYAGASPDLRHIVLSSSAHLTPESQMAPPGGRMLFDWTSGNLQLVSALPNGEPVSGVLGSSIGASRGSIDDAVSNDGRFVFWSAEQSVALYARDTVAAETIRLDLPAPGASGEGPENPIFQGASADGRRVFFTDEQQLTPDASDTGRDLYVCQLVAAGGKTTCDLSDVTETAGGSAAVQGMTAGISRDGNTVYFVANGVLAPGADQGRCLPLGATPPAARRVCNLYVASLVAGSWQSKYMATVSNRDAPLWGLPGESKVNQVADISPSGRYFAFMSSRNLTGYDNADAGSGQAALEVYLYDATLDRLSCVSCNPTAARPDAAKLMASGEAPLIDANGLWLGRIVSGTLPEAEAPGEVMASVYYPRAVLDNGRVFFNSVESLVPRDANGAADVYEYEPEGVGSCDGTVTGMTAVVSNGCISLLSGGISNRESAFLDAGADGNDAFILTSARLVTEDIEGGPDVYDVHACTTTSPCPPSSTSVSPMPCGEAAECRQPASAIDEGALPASATPNGNGNVKPHHKRRHRKARRHPRHHHGKRRGHHQHNHSKRPRVGGYIGGVK